MWDYRHYELEISDSFTLAQGHHTIEEVFITQYPVEFVQDGVLLIRGHSCCAKLIFDGRATYEVCEEKYTDHSAKSDSVNRIVIKYTTGLREIQIKTKIKIEYVKDTNKSV